MEKLTLEKFLIIKKKLSVVIEVLSKEYADRIETFNYEEIAKIINDRYITIQKELYDYDLSDIPFEACKDVVIIGTKDHIADFSKTKANKLIILKMKLWKIKIIIVEETQEQYHMKK